MVFFVSATQNRDFVVGSDPARPASTSKTIFRANVPFVRHEEEPPRRMRELVQPAGRTDRDWMLSETLRFDFFRWPSLTSSKPRVRSRSPLLSFSCYYLMSSTHKFSSNARGDLECIILARAIDLRSPSRPDATPIMRGRGKKKKRTKERKSTEKRDNTVASNCLSFELPKMLLTTATLMTPVITDDFRERPRVSREFPCVYPASVEQFFLCILIWFQIAFSSELSGWLKNK